MISPEQREAFVGDSSNSITYLSIAIVVAGILAIIILISQLLKKLEVNKWSDWGVKVLMINVGIEILTFLALYISVTANLISPDTSPDTLMAVASYNMYFNMILQVVATVLVLFGGIVAYKKVK